MSMAHRYMCATRSYTTDLLSKTFASAALIGEGDLFTLENSKANQKLIDAVYRAGKKDGWEPV